MKNMQQRHFDYVLGPNQDSRLASVANGAVMHLVLPISPNAPFVLTGRAVYCSTVAGGAPAMAYLAGLRTRFSGPNRDYRPAGKQAYMLESLQCAYYGQFGCPKPIVPAIVYPAGSILMLDFIYSGTNASYQTITNLSFYFRGYELYPPDTVPAYTYPRRMSSQTFADPVLVASLGVSETRLDQIYTVKQDADFVVRGGQGMPSYRIGGVAPTIRDVSIILKDFNKMPYASDYVPLSVLFGKLPLLGDVSLGANAAVQTGAFGTGPGAPGLFYPEIYVPKNHQLLFDIQRSDNVAGQVAAADVLFNYIGSKVFDK